MYRTVEEMLMLCRKQQKPIWQVVLENEVEQAEKSEDELMQELERRFNIMEAAARKALYGPIGRHKNLINGIAAVQYHYAAKASQKGKTICGPLVNKIMAYALSGSEVNASMGRICAAPTAGACGILPAVLIGIGEEIGLDKQTLLKGLLVATGFGQVITKNATVSGAEGGCQAECGSAAAMAAAAAVYLYGGLPTQSATACAIALSNAMGLICDPVAGLVQVPCAQRNASQSVNAILSADMALSGIEFPIPADQVIVAMKKVGRLLPEALKETAQGGIADTPAGKQITKEIKGSVSWKEEVVKGN